LVTELLLDPRRFLFRFFDYSRFFIVVFFLVFALFFATTAVAAVASSSRSSARAIRAMNGRRVERAQFFGAKRAVAIEQAHRRVGLVHRKEKKHIPKEEAERS